MQAMAPTIETIEYNMVAGNYDEFIAELRRVLAEYEPAGDRERVMDRYGAPHPVLARQRPQQPARWIHIKLAAQSGHTTTLAVRDDNVYLIGFMNQQRRWFEFGYVGRSKRVLPADRSSTFLECDVTYGNMVGGGMNLLAVELGRGFAMDAVRRLSAYEQAPGHRIDAATKRDLARLIVAICESARMTPHWQTVRHGWDGMVAATIDERQVHYLWNWRRMSHAVLKWHRWLPYWGVVPQPPWPQELLTPEVRVEDVAQALQVVQLLLNFPEPRVEPRRQPPQGTTIGASDGTGGNAGDVRRQWHGAAAVLAQGQPMLEVYRVVDAGGYFHMRGGGATISVFDGMRGQIIYSGKPADDLAGDTVADVFDGSDAAGAGGHGQHFAKRMFAHLRSIYDHWAVFGWNSNHDRRTIASKQQGNGSMFSGHELELTGPFRAISAHGSVSIEVDCGSTTAASSPGAADGISTTVYSMEEIVGTSTASTTGDYVKIDISREEDDDRDSHGETLLWDCYDDDANDGYDRPLTRTISTRHGPLLVTYAVLSNAAEATVKVKLVAVAGDEQVLVHGRITACCHDIDVESVLFSRGQGDRVAATHDDHGDYHVVPLSRSVVAVPLTSQLLVAATLHCTPASWSSNQTAGEGVLPASKPIIACFKPSGEEEVQRLGVEQNGEVEIKITWASD